MDRQIYSQALWVGDGLPASAYHRSRRYQGQSGGALESMGHRRWAARSEEEMGWGRPGWRDWSLLVSVEGGGLSEVVVGVRSSQVRRDDGGTVVGWRPVCDGEMTTWVFLSQIPTAATDFTDTILVIVNCPLSACTVHVIIRHSTDTHGRHQFWAKKNYVVFIFILFRWAPIPWK